LVSSVNTSLFSTPDSGTRVINAVTNLRHEAHDDTKLTMDPKKRVLRVHRGIVFIVLIVFIVGAMS
jgi:hypothetical protein